MTEKTAKQKQAKQPSPTPHKRMEAKAGRRKLPATPGDHTTTKLLRDMGRYYAESGFRHMLYLLRRRCSESIAARNRRIEQSHAAWVPYEYE